jgi:uncharacterized protein YkwD
MRPRLEFVLVTLIVLAACSQVSPRPQVTNPPPPSPTKTPPPSPSPTPPAPPPPSPTPPSLPPPAPPPPSPPPSSPPPPSPPPSTFEAQTLERINAARAQARSCGAQRFAAAPKVAWNNRLGATADAHTRDMIAKDFFAHVGSDGGNVGTRATRAGYAWGAVGENIAAGYASLDGVMRGWLESPGHCANLMNPNFTEVGLATRSAKNTKYTSYWTLVLARPK